MHVKSEKRHPLRNMPRRLAGQSVSERRSQLVEDRVLFPMMAAAFLITLAAIEWVHYITLMPPRPWLFTALAVLGIAYATRRIVQTIPKARALRLAEQGERSVAEGLETLRSKGYEVFHDVLGDGFNLDHVVIGPAGVFTVETKARMKPAQGKPTILFDGTTVKVAGWEPDRDPIVQARAPAAWLRELLGASTGRTVPVKPVVVYPGWYVEGPADRHRELWVLNPKALPAFLDHEPQLLLAEDTHLLAFHLSRFIETTVR